MKPFLLLLSVAAELLSGCANVTPVPMEALGPRLDEPAHIALVAQDSPYARLVKPGDVVVAIDGRPVTTMQEAAFSFVSEKTVGVRTSTGQLVELPGSAFLRTDTVAAAVSLFPEQRFMTIPVTSVVYGPGRVGAGWVVFSDNTFEGAFFGTALASLIRSPTRYVEVELTAQAHPKCEEQCKLQNVGMLDMSLQRWLRPVRIENVAYTMYPDAGAQAPQTVAVPAPTVSGYSATSSSYGSVSGGTYSGTSQTYITPQYDYTATNFANMYNLGAIMQQDVIRQSNEKWRAFVSARESTLNTGVLRPGASKTAFLFFELPEEAPGPFVVVVLTEGAAPLWGIAQFRISP